MRNPDRTIECLSHENIRVRLSGDCSVLPAVTVVKGKHQGELVAGEFPYMRVWVGREGPWIAAATQSAIMGH